MDVEPSLALLAMTQSIGTFTTFLPPLTAVAEHTLNDPQFAKTVRVGEIAAASLTLGIGSMISSLTGSPAPVVISGMTALAMIVVYEMTLRSDPAYDVKGHD